jgi:outer membrane protein
MKHNVFHSLALAALAALAGGAAQAQSAGQTLFKVGVNNINPQVDSGDLSAPSLPNTKIDVKDATSLIVTAAYMVTDNVSTELFLGLPYKHDVVGAGSIASAGKLGTIKQVSPTIFAQYRFLDANSAFRPYAGLGLTYAYFYGEEGSGTLTALTNPGGGTATRMSVDSAWGWGPQLGATFRMQDRWYLDGSVIKTYVKTTSHLSTGQHIDTKLDPLSVNVSVGYRF